MRQQHPALARGRRHQHGHRSLPAARPELVGHLAQPVDREPVLHVRQVLAAGDRCVGRVSHHGDGQVSPLLRGRPPARRRRRGHRSPAGRARLRRRSPGGHGQPGTPMRSIAYPASRYAGKAGKSRRRANIDAVTSRITTARAMPSSAANTIPAWRNSSASTIPAPAISTSRLPTSVSIQPAAISALRASRCPPAGSARPGVQRELLEHRHDPEQERHAREQAGQHRRANGPNVRAPVQRTPQHQDRERRREGDQGAVRLDQRRQRQAQAAERPGRHGRRAGQAHAGERREHRHQRQQRIVHPDSGEEDRERAQRPEDRRRRAGRPRGKLPSEQVQGQHAQHVGQRRRAAARPGSRCRSPGRTARTARGRAADDRPSAARRATSAETVSSYTRSGQSSEATSSMNGSMPSRLMERGIAARTAASTMMPTSTGARPTTPGAPSTDRPSDPSWRPADPSCWRSPLRPPELPQMRWT